MSVKTKDEIIKAIQDDRILNGMTLYQLVDKYKLSKSAIYGFIKNCDSSNVKRASPTRKVVEKVNHLVNRPLLSKGTIGEAARQLICARLMFQGINVYKPVIEDTPIDLLILRKDNIILKCQCKYIYPIKNGAHVLLCCTVRKNNPSKKAVKHIYSKKEIIGYCLDNDSVYVVPIEDTNGQASVKLWINREPITQNGNKVFDSSKYKNNFELLISPRSSVG